MASRQLDAYLYYLLGEELPADGHFENLMEASRWGFKISQGMKKVKTLEEIYEYIRYWDAERKNLPVATDGIVLKENAALRGLAKSGTPCGSSASSVIRPRVHVGL